MVSLERAKIDLVLSFDVAKISNFKISGYFSEEDRELLVKYETGWEETLVHEFNHFIQYYENSSIWTSLDYKGTNCIALMWDWLDGNIELNKSDLNTVFGRVRDLEHDCEKRSVKMIKQFGLTTIDIEKYICEANIYILFYNLAKEKRMWFPNNVGPNSMTKVFNLIPKTIYGSRTRQSMSDELYNLMESYF